MRTRALSYADHGVCRIRATPSSSPCTFRANARAVRETRNLFFANVHRVFLSDRGSVARRLQSANIASMETTEIPTIGGQQQVMTFTSYEYGPVDAALFTPPPLIATLIQQKPRN